VNARTRQALAVFVTLLALGTASYAIFLGYLTPDMMVYFLSFRWCF
jgi:hypothetical protein